MGVVGALSAFYRDAADVNDPNQRDMAALRIIAKMPTLAAIAYKTAVGVCLLHRVCRHHIQTVALSFAEDSVMC